MYSLSACPSLLPSEDRDVSSSSDTRGGEGESDGITNFCSSHLSQGRRRLDRAIHLPPTLGYAPRRLEEGEFSPTFVKIKRPLFVIR